MTLKKKNISKGFTLVEITVVLVIIMVLVVTSVPTMLGFILNTKQKALISEVGAVYVASQFYTTEHFANGESDQTIANSIKGTINSTHVLYHLLQNDATGKILDVKVTNGKVENFSYAIDNITANYKVGVGVSFTKDVYVSNDIDASSLPNQNQVVKNTTFDIGEIVNVKMKKLAGNTSSTVDNNTTDYNIKGISKADTLPGEFNTKDSTHVLSESSAEYPIFAWYENNRIYYYTEADKIFLNSDSSYLFCCCMALTDISVLRECDASKVTSLSYAFSYCAALADITALQNWDTSHVTSLEATFDCCSSLTDITALQDWNTSNVTVLDYTFCHCASLANITALREWDISNVTSLSCIFGYCTALTNITALQDWDISKVTSLGYAFYDCINLIDATCLENWNTSNVESKECTFGNTAAVNNGKTPSWYN